ncbi:MAG: hypothetical protein GTN74_15140 [Proteobacteria bacterium]|nr:hypothetical protein [Pseudomonadota bacterium]NIS72671.1 hypothetical protein [Pseudomonadota bacterium]
MKLNRILIQISYRSDIWQKVNGLLGIIDGVSETAGLKLQAKIKNKKRWWKEVEELKR